MPFGYALFFSVMATSLTISFVTFWAAVFRFDISGKIVLWAHPILGVAFTVYLMMVPEKVLMISMVVGIILTLLTCVAAFIRNFIEKNK